MDAAADLIQVVRRFQAHPNRSSFPPDSLSIDPFPERYSIGHRVLKLDKGNGSNIRRLSHSDPEEISRTIMEERAFTPAEMREIGLIVVGFFFHDIETHAERMRFLEAIQRQSPEAVLIVNDYTLRGLPRENVLAASNSSFERERIREFGEDEYVRTHCRFTLGGLLGTIGQVYEVRNARRSAAGRSIAIGMPDRGSARPTPSELLGMEEDLPTVMMPHIPAGVESSPALADSYA